MGQVTMYSVGGVCRDPMYLALIGKCVLIGGPSGGDFVNGDLPGGRRSIATQEERDRFERDYEVICEAMSAQPHPFKIHSSINNVPRYAVERLTEQGIAEKLETGFGGFVNGLTREKGHLGDVVVCGAHPVITADELVEALNLFDDPIYEIRPFREAVGRYPHEHFFVPYDVLLDVEGFTAWILDSRKNFGAHTTIVNMVERDSIWCII